MSYYILLSVGIVNIITKASHLSRF